MPGKKQRITFTHCNKTFSSIAEVKRFFVDIRDSLFLPRGEIGEEFIVEPTHEHFNFLVDLLSRHHLLGKAASAGRCKKFRFAFEIPPLMIREIRAEKTQYVWINDGWTNFSYRKCLYTQENNQKTYQAKSARLQIQDQITRKRQELGKWVNCAECNSYTSKYHIDHITPFKNILASWKNEEKKEDFSTYHMREAKLQPLCVTCHNRKSRNDYRKDANVKISQAKPATLQFID